jgi:predicted transposase YbfD/YdcC
MMNEDASQVDRGNAAKLLGSMRHMALNMLV